MGVRHAADRGGHIRYRISLYRMLYGLTQQELADRAGLSREFLSMIETGSRPPSRYTTLASIADGLGVDVTALTFLPLDDLRFCDDLDLQCALRLDLHRLQASVEPSSGGSPALVLGDGVARVELSGDPNEPRRSRNGMERIVAAIRSYHASTHTNQPGPTTPAVTHETGPCDEPRDEPR